MLDGGPATLVYGFLFCWLGAMVSAASLAEMASMYEALTFLTTNKPDIDAT